MKAELVIFGNTQMVRVYCEGCFRYCFVVDGEKLCCGVAVNVELEARPKSVRRVCEPEGRRRTPKPSEKHEILEAQGHRCLYCDVSLDGYVTYRGKIRKVRLNWDHMIPYAYAQNNHHRNFAASCNFCNAWKSSKIFATVEEVRVYVAEKWQREREREEKLQAMRG